MTSPQPTQSSTRRPGSSSHPTRSSTSTEANIGCDVRVRLPPPPAADQRALTSEWKAASAAPRAPAMSRSGMSANVATLSCS